MINVDSIILDQYILKSIHWLSVLSRKNRPYLRYGLLLFILNPFFFYFHFLFFEWSLYFPNPDFIFLILQRFVVSSNLSHILFGASPYRILNFSKATVVLFFSPQKIEPVATIEVSSLFSPKSLQSHQSHHKRALIFFLTSVPSPWHHQENWCDWCVFGVWIVSNRLFIVLNPSFIVKNRNF